MSQSQLRLGVNIDHIATLRQARGTRYPDPVRAALLAIQGGADSITVHLREDRRHIQERDVRLLMQTIDVPLNLEMAATPAMVELALSIKPQHCCLVPERREELTTEGGLDVVAHGAALKEICQTLANAEINVSLFIDPIEKQIEAAANTGAPTIELHTGTYANTSGETQHKELMRIVEAAATANELDLMINAGHGLHYQNVSAIAEVLFFSELNIGHSIVAEAAMVGMVEAVSRMKQLLQYSRQNSKLEFLSLMAEIQQPE